MLVAKGLEGAQQQCDASNLMSFCWPWLTLSHVVLHPGAARSPAGQRVVFIAEGLEGFSSSVTYLLKQHCRDSHPAVWCNVTCQAVLVSHGITWYDMHSFEYDHDLCQKSGSRGVCPKVGNC